MSIKKILSISLKVLAAGVAGIVAFMGIGKLTEEKKEKINEEPASTPQQEQAWGNVTSQPQTGKETVGVTVVNTLGKIHSVTGKITGLVQSMAMFAENAVRLFDKEGSQRLNYLAQQQQQQMCYSGLPPVGSECIINGQRIARPYENKIVFY